MSTSDRSARTRRELLDAAWGLIAERGAEVSMAEIAAAVGVTRQSVYVHFGSRGGLLMALVRRADERGRIIERLTEALAVPEPGERLDRSLRAWLEFVVDIHPVALDLIRLRTQDADAALAWEDRMTDLLELFRALITSIAAQGALAPGWSEEQATDVLWATCSVQTWALLVRDRGWSPDDAAAAIRRTAAAALLAPPTS